MQELGFMEAAQKTHGSRRFPTYALHNILLPVCEHFQNFTGPLV